MYKELEGKRFDCLLVGTNLTDSILSAHLSRCGKKVLHLDVAQQYGADCKNLNFRDLDDFLVRKKSGKLKDIHMDNLEVVENQIFKKNFHEVENKREYNFDFNPKFIYSKSKSTEELTNSKASSYLEFCSVKKIFTQFGGNLMSVPSTKSEIFMSDDLELVEKQKLLNFIFAVMKLKKEKVDVNTTIDIKKDYEVEEKVIQEIVANLACKAGEFLEKRFSAKLRAIIQVVLSNKDPNLISNEETVDSLITKIYKHLISLQIYDESPFLYPIYGSSEFTQALSRVSSLFGGTFVVSESLQIGLYKNNESSLDKSVPYFVVQVTDLNNGENFEVFADFVVCNENCLNKQPTFVFGENVKEENILVKKVNNINRLVAFYIIEAPEEARKEAEGPIVYKIPKGECGELGLIGYEYFRNCHSVPKDRSLLQLVITSENSDDRFLLKAKESCAAFTKRHLELLSNTIGKNHPTYPRLTAEYIFYEEIPIYKFERNQSCKILFTQNDFSNFDLDFYFTQAESHMKELQWDNLEPIEMKDLHKEEESDEGHQDELIDELFNTLNV